MKEYELLDKFYMRTPTLSWDIAIKILNEDNIQKLFDLLRTILSDHFVKLAIYVASPDLYHRWETLENGGVSNKKEVARILQSIAKYILRMSTRCTPFGLFAANSIGNYAKNTNIVLPVNQEGIKSIVLDSELIFNLKDKILENKKLWPYLNYYSNPCLYKSGDRLRFVNDYKDETGNRKYEISSIQCNDLISYLLEKGKKGISFQEIVKSITDFDYPLEDAVDFTYELIEHQVYKSEFEPSIVGKDYTSEFIKIISRLNSIKELKSLGELQTIVKIINVYEENSSEINLEKLKKIHGFVLAATQNLNLPPQKLAYQLDFKKELIKNDLSYKIPATTRKGMEILNKIGTLPKNKVLDRFKEDFFTRYENRLVPLLEALDPDVGIVFGNDAYDYLPLLNGLDIKNNSVETIDLEWDSNQNFIFNKVINALKESSKEIVLKDDDVDNLKSSWNNTNDSIAVLLQLIENEQGNGPKILLHGTRGTSGANIITRFTFLGHEFYDLVNRIFKKEQELSKGITLCEVSHMPNYPRAINVLHRKNNREYSIPFLSNSINKKNTIDLDDIYIYHRNNHLHLWSKKLDAEILPKLTTAHLYEIDAHPIYHFFGAIQSQNIKAQIEFNWSSLFQKFVELPRITYKNIILQRRIWFFKDSHLKDMLKTKGKDLKIIENFLIKWHLPETFVLIDRDNELPINIRNPISRDTFLREIKEKRVVVLCESISPSKDVKDQDNNVYNNQLVTFFTKKEIKEVVSPKPIFNTNTKRRFFPTGDEWIYFKIYLGTSLFDRFLVNEIYPLIKLLIAEDLIKNFFFIRYYDTDFHLRIRFQIYDNLKRDRVIFELNKIFTLNSCLIKKIQEDTYERELERYGNNTIHLCEEWFFMDSMSHIEAIKHFFKKRDAEQKRWIYALLSIHDILESFGLTLEERIFILNSRDFSINIKREARRRYRQDSLHFIPLLEGEVVNNDWNDIFEIRIRRNEKFKELFQSIEIKYGSRFPDEFISKLIISFIHMSINRISVNRSNTQEGVLCTYLSQYYSSQFAKEKALEQSS